MKSKYNKDLQEAKEIIQRFFDHGIEYFEDTQDNDTNEGKQSIRFLELITKAKKFLRGEK